MDTNKLKRMNLANKAKEIVDTSLAVDISKFSNKTKYDNICKKLLSYKEILARILKECVSEYKDCDIGSIIKCIDSNVLLQEEDVHYGTVKITDNTEDDNGVDGLIRYDIKFSTRLPDNSKTQMIINIEAQNKYSAGYPLIKRGVYYASRLISAQRGTIFYKEDYSKIQKVYSIWICIDNLRLKEPKITEFTLAKEEHLGMRKQIEKKDYDLIDIIIIRLCEDPSNYNSDIIKLLTCLLTNKYDLKERKRILKEDYNIEMEEIHKGVTDMSSLSEAVFQEGKLEGELKKQVEIAKNMLMQNLSITMISECTGLSKEEIEKLK